MPEEKWYQNPEKASQAAAVIILALAALLTWLFAGEEVKKMFEEYPWPGNVRELRNTIEGAFNVAQGKCIHARDLTGYIVQQCGQHEKDSLPCSTGADEGPSGLNDQIHSVEKRIIEDALKKTSTYAEAARLIGISRQAFMYKMKKYKIDV